MNEVAPRPHNSGHHTIEACVTSQYENHLRAVIGLPLGDTAMKVNSAVMVNILGEEDVSDELVPNFKINRTFLQLDLLVVLNQSWIVLCDFFTSFQGNEGFKLAHDFMARALSIDGASVHWYNKPGNLFLIRFCLI